MQKKGNHIVVSGDSSGTTLIELLVVLAIFSVVMAGLYSSYSVLMREGLKQYTLSQSEMEYQIAKSVIERDIAMAGYGIADLYCSPTSTSSVYTAPVNTNTCLSGVQCSDFNLPSYQMCVPADLLASPQLLYMSGTALGRSTRASQAWSYTLTNTPSSASDFASWTDAREQLKSGDRIIYLNPNNKSLMYTPAPGEINNDTQKAWLFPYPGTSSSNPYPTVGDDGYFVYGLVSSGSASVPYYIVEYSLNNSNLPQFCAPGSSNLMRLESMNDPPQGTPQPLMNCVLDFETALGLDVNGDGIIDCWDLNGSACASGYPSETLRAQLKQVKMFILLQEGNYDPNFNFGSGTFSVGDSTLHKCVWDPAAMVCAQGGGVVGNTITVPSQNYRWRMLTLDVAPRNIR